MFNRDKGETTEHVTQAQVESYRTSVESDLTSLSNRLEALETLARQLRTGSQFAQEAQVAAAPATSTQDRALTLEDASVALDSLKTESLAQFRQTRDEIAELSAHLSRKVDAARDAVTQHVSGNTSAVMSHAHTVAASDTSDVRLTQSVDYGAVAFGLAQIKHDVTHLMRGVNVDAASAEVAQHYAATVQYFADVFAKSNTAFDEAEFKRQAGM